MLAGERLHPIFDVTFVHVYFFEALILEVQHFKCFAINIETP